MGIVIAFGIVVSTVLGRFVIPIYYVLGERIIEIFGRGREEEAPALASTVVDRAKHRNGTAGDRQAEPSGIPEVAR